MTVTKEEMELLQRILDVEGPFYQGDYSFKVGEANELLQRWRERGVRSSDFQLLTEGVRGMNTVQSSKRFPTLNGSSSLPPQSPSSSSPPLSHPPKAPGLSQAKKEKKQRLTLKSVLDAVRPDLTLQSPSFVDAWTRWVENRLQLPKPTLGAFQIHMAKCATMGERRAIAAITRSAVPT
jgi:hypothetical protein